MLARIIIAVLVGGAVGLAVGYTSHLAGGQCPILCNPYISTGLGVLIALFIVSRTGGAVQTEASSNLVQLRSDAAYDAAINDPGGVVLIEFYTDYCPACRRQLPALNSLADRFAGRALVAIVNAARVRNVSKRENIQGVPTILLYAGGKQVKRVVGLTAENRLAGLIEKYLPAAPQTDQQG